MNELIRELAKDNYCRTEYDNGTIHACYEFSENELCEFVRLTVREVADYAYPYDEGKFRAILKHFGVER